MKDYEDYIVTERIRGLSVLYNTISRYGSLKVREKITRKVLAKLISNPSYKPIRKKVKGKIRLLHVPSKNLKILLKAILHTILYDFPVSSSAHGGVPRCSTVTNTQAHLGSHSFFKIDFKDYFPSITTKMVSDCLIGLFDKNLRIGFLRNCGLVSFREARGLAKIIARVATHNNLLPQGAPTSPCIQNLILYDLDEKILELTRKYSIVYTRFTDDMVFSSKGLRIPVNVRREIVGLIKKEVGNFLKFNRKKIHYRTGKARVPVITGVTIVPTKEGTLNLSISKKQMQRFRAILHQASIGQSGFKEVWGIIGLIKMVKGKIPNRLKNSFLQFLANQYPRSWDQKLDRYKDLL